MPPSDALRVEALTVAFRGGGHPVVRGVSFDIGPGEAFGLVGESGSGKSLTCRAILRLLPRGATGGGRVTYGARSLLELDDAEMQALRGSTIAMIFQDPMTALNPVLRVGDAIAQVVASHERLGARAARRRALEMMERVGIRDAARRAAAYPHEFSGGMRQRIHIAMALAARPTLLLADEPTTALDVIVQAEILRLLDGLRREQGMSLLLVSHDFRVVAGLCDRVGVMYAGELVEIGPTPTVLHRPEHPYTVGLLNSLPEAVSGERLRAIPGAPPDPEHLPQGCAFAPRCPLAVQACGAAPIPLSQTSTGHLSRCVRIDRVDGIRRGSATAVPSGP
ncbi:MAG TPA: ABC transporter ATP-binding protein [bacterium]|nr:ABC transporter ATP-binding protein [bacterium]